MPWAANIAAVTPFSAARDMFRGLDMVPWLAPTPADMVEAIPMALVICL